MSDTEALTKAIDKAIDGGWTASWASKKEITVYYLGYYHKDRRFESFGLDKPFRLIFNHDFAKALWVEKIWMLSDLGGWISPDAYDGHSLGAEEMPAWQYHLQQMVISENPLQYLANYLETENE